METFNAGQARTVRRSHLNAVDLLSKDTMKDFQELADEAFADLLVKHNRPTDLKSALRKSVTGTGAAGAIAKKPATSARRRRRT
jgi:hypothetical protein